MSTWLIVLIVVVLAAVGFVYWRSRQNSRGGQSNASAAGTQPPRDYVQEREESRVSKMSQEDRDWEAASLQKNRDSQGQNPPPPPAS